MTVTERGRGGSYRASRGALVARRLARVEAVCHVTCPAPCTDQASQTGSSPLPFVSGGQRVQGLLQSQAACRHLTDMSGGGVTRCYSALLFIEVCKHGCHRVISATTGWLRPSPQFVFSQRTEMIKLHCECISKKFQLHQTTFQSDLFCCFFQFQISASKQ